MPAQTRIIRIPRPFTKGWVTDRPPWSLDPQEMADGQDVFWPRGVAVMRRPWDYVQAQNPLGSSDTLAGVMAVQFSPQSSTVTYVVTDVNGRVGIANTGSAQVAFTGQSGVTYLPRAYFDGEVLLCPQDGVSPILRWSGLNGSLTNIVNITYDSLATSSGPTTATSLQHARNSPVITGSNTTFTTQSPASSYIAFNKDGNFGLNMRVEKVDSNTSLALKSPPFMLSTASSPVTLTDFTLTASPYGVLGLRVAVADMGTATISSTSLTGQGTTWTTSGRGYGALAAGDVIARLAQPAIGSNPAVTSPPTAGVISSVTNATSATLSFAPGTTLTTAPYVALRAMPGREVCAHQGRLWITGVDWEPNRVYVTPPDTSGYELGQQFNGQDSPEVDFAAASQAKFIEVPDRFADGRIVSLLSGRNVLLVLRTNNCYGVFGAWPGVTVEQIADGAGCVDIRAAISADDGLYWCGEEGIYRYVPGRGIQDITAMKVNREWRRLMRERSDGAIVSMGVVNKHIVISYLDGPDYGIGSGDQGAETWVYDTVTDTWCGSASDIFARYMNTARLRGLPDDLFFVEGDPAVRRIGALASSFTDDDSEPISGANVPNFFASSGSVLTGGATDLFRPVEVRVAYECEGTDSSIDVSTANVEGDMSFPTSQYELPETFGEIATQKLRARTNALDVSLIGKQTRRFGVLFQSGPVAPERLVVHELQIVAREYNTRD